MLLVLDDVWKHADVVPFRGLAPGSALLVTTRDSRTLPRGSRRVEFDAMEVSEAAKLLASGLEVADPALRENEVEGHERKENRRSSYFRPAPETTTAGTMVGEGVE